MTSAVLFDLKGTLVNFQGEVDKAEETLRQARVVLGFGQEVFDAATYAVIRRGPLARAAPQVWEEIDPGLTPFAPVTIRTPVPGGACDMGS